MNKYVVAYACLFNGTNELLVVESTDPKNAVVLALKSKGWKIETYDDVASCPDIFVSEAKLVSSL